MRGIMQTARIVSLGLAAVVGLTLVAPPVRAQEDSGQRSAAGDATFNEGVALLNEKKFSEACPKFAASFKIDPLPGTKLALARCHELEGKTASAYGDYLDAEAMAKRDGDKKREDTARGKAAELLPKLARLKVAVEGKVEGLKVKRDGIFIEDAVWGSALPADVGEHVVEASAPGYVTWSGKITITKDGETQSLVVPPLEKEKVAPKPEPPKPDPVKPPPVVPPPPVDDGSSYRTQRAIGLTVGVIGVVGLASGTTFGLLARSKWNGAKDDCPGNVCKTQSAQDDAERAKTFANVSTVSFGVGVVGLVSGLVLFFTAPEPKPGDAKAAFVQVAPSVGAGSVGVVVGGAF